jgi:addiction module RelE/StbE family toxin
MAEIFYSREALADLQRLIDFLSESAPRAAEQTSDLIFDAIEILRRHPRVGRIAEEGLRELVISRGRSGYIALYRFDADTDAVFVLALRHQRELDIGAS